MTKYQWVLGEGRDDLADEYEALHRPDGSEVTVITEPEDRNGFRDLAPVADECNRLHDIATRLSVLATKYCPKDHHDWQRLMELCEKL
jgi:hypothetical protein